MLHKLSSVTGEGVYGEEVGVVRMRGGKGSLDIEVMLMCTLDGSPDEHVNFIWVHKCLWCVKYLTYLKSVIFLY